MEEVFCFNHPENKAKRKCYLCKKFICKKCAIRKYNHIFCSIECASEYKKEQILTKLKKSAKRKVPLSFLILLILIPFFILFFIFYKYKEEIFTSRFAFLKERVPSKNFLLKIKREEKYPFYHFSFNSPEKGGILLSGEKGNLLWYPTLKGKNSFFSFFIPPPEEAIFLPQGFLKLNKSFNRGSPSIPILCITFDGGSKKGSSEEIIKILKEEELKVTFFLTGKFIKNYPEIVKEIEKEGHEVGNHTYSHPHLTTYFMNFKQETLEKINYENIRVELSTTNNLYKALTGKEMVFFWKETYGDYNGEIIKWGWMAGYYHIGWSWDSLDWMEEDFPNFERRINKINELKEKIQKNEKELYGQILLFHLGSNNIGEIKEIIKLIKSKNIQIVPVSTLLATDTFSKL